MDLVLSGDSVSLVLFRRDELPPDSAPLLVGEKVHKMYRTCQPSITRTSFDRCVQRAGVVDEPHNIASREGCEFSHNSREACRGFTLGDGAAVLLQLLCIEASGIEECLVELEVTTHFEVVPSDRAQDVLHSGLSLPAHRWQR